MICTKNTLVWSWDVQGEPTPRERFKPPRWVKITALVVVISGVLAVLGGVGGLVGLFWYYGRDIEAIDEDALRDYRPPQTTRVLDRNGVLIDSVLYEADDSYVTLRSAYLQRRRAKVAGEDSTETLPDIFDDEQDQ